MSQYLAQSKSKLSATSVPIFVQKVQFLSYNPLFEDTPILGVGL